MDVYELIIQKGTLGALKYANQIENKNYRLASQIDEAVVNFYRNEEMVRIAQGQFGYYSPPGQNIKQPDKQYVPPRGQNIKQLEKRDKQRDEQYGYFKVPPHGTPDPDGYLRSPASEDPLNNLKNNLYQAPKLFRARGAINLAQQERLFKAFESALKAGEINKAIDLFKKSNPFYTKLDTPPMRQRFIDSASKILNPTQYTKFLNDVAKIMEQERASRFIPPILKSPAKNLLNLGVAVHPVIKNAPGFESLTPAIKEELMGKSFEDACNILATRTRGTQFFTNFDTYMKSRAPSDFIHRYLSFAPRTKERIVNQGILKLVEKFPQLEGALAKFGGAKIVFGKIIGPIALGMDAINLWRDVDVYGWDGKNICQLVSVIIGAASVGSGALALATGGGTAPITAALSVLWLVASIGCGFVAQHDKPIPGKSTPQLQENTDQITDNNIKNLIGKVKMSDLSMDDQNRARDIFNNWKNNKQAMKRNFYEQAKGGLFKKPVSVLAGLESYLRDGSFF
jgi:lipoprotein-anchoring transpeptidase ErfK/SrfK